MSHARIQAASLGQSTRQILADGFYRTAAGHIVNLAPLLAQARAGVRSYPREASLPNAAMGKHPTRIMVTNETTLAAVWRLASAHRQVAALNFASARYPGGGWLSGAHAQEESLSRASGLVACIADDPMYARHAQSHDALYTSSAIYTPDVPVFRDEAGRLLDTPYLVAFITAPAVNAGVVIARDPSRRNAVTAAMRERIARVLAIAALHEHTALVLGAWGCGVFQNDPAEIAGLFAAALHGPFRGAFGDVIFAVLDTSVERRFIDPFEHAFGGAGGHNEH
jgi:uncharacterized protein (TIGR02452 family)